MSLTVNVDPSEYGFDPSRLNRIQSHFNQYVDDGRLSGWLATITRGGDLVWKGKAGHQDRENDVPVSDDTIWRIYSMTKAITSVAVMMLFEEGKFDLHDDAGKWIPALANPRVHIGGTAAAPKTRAANGPIKIHHLLSHTAGFTYGFTWMHPVDEMYRKLGYEFGWPKGQTLEGAVNDWASCPLVHEPGAGWNYSISVDILGRLVEIWSGMSLDKFLRTRIFDPLGMNDTDWYVPEEKAERLARLYVPFEGKSYPYDEIGQAALRWPSMLGGGGGLVSTAHDYNRFTSLLRGGGELGGVRLLSSRTLELMTRNDIADNLDVASVATDDSRGDINMMGVGYGLGFAVLMDQTKCKTLTSEGSYFWGGAASTAFWVDPVEDITVNFFTQLLPSTTYPIRRELSTLIYQALAD